MEPAFPMDVPHSISRNGTTMATREGFSAYDLRRCLRRHAAAASGRAHSRPSRIFRLLDCDDCGSSAGRGLQHDAAWLGPAAEPGRLPGCETCELFILPDYLGVQPQLH